MSSNFHVFDANDALSEDLASTLEKLSAEAISQRGKFTMAISGGSLPKLAAPGLVASAGKIEFGKWHVFFADERCVPLDHEDSNYAACKKLLFDLVPIPPAQIYTIDAALSPDDAAKAYQEALLGVIGSPVEEVPVLDCLLLGMGPDGHTCSLFPGHPLLAETARWVSFLEDSPKPPPCRITLTLPVVNAARKVLFVATGAGKAELLPRILAGDQALPCAMVQPGQAQWFVDTAAAAKL